MSVDSMKKSSTDCQVCPRKSDLLPLAVNVEDMECTKTNWRHAAGIDRYELVLDRDHVYPEYRLKRDGNLIAYLENRDGWWFFHRSPNEVNSAGEYVHAPAMARASSLTPPTSGWQEYCDGKWKSFQMVLKFESSISVEMRTRTTSVVKADDVSKCLCQAPMKLVGGICVCGKGSYLNVITNACVQSPANHFQQYEHSMSTHPCPEGALSDVGSMSPDACQCKTRMRKIEDPDRPSRQKCICDDGYYMLNGQCEKCRYCQAGDGVRYWLKGCGDTSQGVCTECMGCSNPEETLVGCHARSPGVCTLKRRNGVRWLSAEPMCPVVTTVGSISTSRSLDLGGMAFTHVFGATKEDVSFACRDVCDGTRDYDGTQCGGPYACNIRTCTQFMQTDRSVDAARNDVLACPVVIEAGDEVDDELRLFKVQARCVACAECGRDGALEALPPRARERLAAGWGRGCARECSRLRCGAGSGVEAGAARNLVWDWTAGACVGCTELRDPRLCAAENYAELREFAVTGHLALLFFEGCRGAEFALDEVTYGRCQRCDTAGARCAAAEYPARCVAAGAGASAAMAAEGSAGAGAVVLAGATAGGGLAAACDVCRRAYQGQVEVVQGAYAATAGANTSTLFCQVTECLRRDGAARTGVRQDGTLCGERCRALVCPADEVLVPCRLPHPTRCVRAAVSPGGLTPGARRAGFVGAEASLLGDASGFASFENTLLTLGLAKDEYQCVWNAAGITDNRALPGGVSEYFFPPALAYASGQEGARGTKACRAWPLQGADNDVVLPALPLQNTVSGRSARRVLVDCEAHVVSYRFDGTFAGVDNMDAVRVAEAAGGDAEALAAVRVAGLGELFMLLTLRQGRASVRADAGGAAGDGAVWPARLLLTCALADLTLLPGRARMDLA